MKRTGLIVALLGLVAGCGGASQITRSPAPTTLAGAVGDHRTPAPAQGMGPLAMQGPLSAASQPVQAPQPKGQCDAPSLTYLIGRPRTEIPVPADLSHRRVACTTCPGGDGYRPDRTNILFNASTGIITAVNCG